jgi:outer membrane protein
VCFCSRCRIDRLRILGLPEDRRLEDSVRSNCSNCSFLIAGNREAQIYSPVCNTAVEPGEGSRNSLEPRDLAPVCPNIAEADHNKEIKVNSRMLTALRSQSISIRTAGLAAACVLSAASALAQGAPAAGSSASGKVGVIGIRQAIVATAEGKQAQAELQSQFAPRQTELENLTKQINDVQQRLQAGQGKISQEEETRLTAQGTKLTQQLDRKRTEFQEDLNSAQGEVFDRIGRKMVEVLDRYSRENGYSVVLDTSAQNTPVLYASNQVDLTQDIVRLYDQSYPIKATATPTKPAAQRPAAPATQPPAAKPQR